MRNFRTYDIWLEAVDFAFKIYKATSSFPKNELYALCDQLQRASVSISSNIAEGCSRNSEKEFVHFLEMAIGSAFEVETQLYIANGLSYITENQYNELILSLDKIERQLNCLIYKIRKSVPESQEQTTNSKQQK